MRMNVDKLRQILTECNRNILELQNEITEALQYKQVLLRHRSALSPHWQHISQLELYYQVMQLEVTRIDAVLDRSRCSLSKFLALQGTIEHSIAASFRG